MIIAIDGPGGSGKSTVSRGVARALDLAHLDTGAMYRAVTYAALQAGIDLSDGDALSEMARGLQLEVGERVIVNGEDATSAIRDRPVSSAVSQVSAHPGVRKEMVARQRRWAADHDGGVIEGRDIGSVVFPEARLKVFLTAEEAERARRRAGQAASPIGAETAGELARRDALDSGRTVSPLAVADGAVVIDTTDLGVDEVVRKVLALL